MNVRTRLFLATIGLLVAGSVAYAFLVSNSRVGTRFVFEQLPANRRPANVLVDTDAVPGVASPLAVVQDLMNQWNTVPEAEAVFGDALVGGPYNGTTVGSTFGTFTNSQFEVAFDETGDVLSFFGIGQGVLGITLKSVTPSNGNLLDFLVVINTRPGALTAPGSGATTEQLFRATLLHELGHAAGLGHTPTGIVNPSTFGFSQAGPSVMPTMFAFRLPIRPQEGGSLEADDAAGLTEIYPADTSGLGAITGTVRGVGAAGVNEVVVRALGPDGSAELGHVSVLTNANATGLGEYRIPHLPPGRYRVILETINGRGSVMAATLAGTDGDALGGMPFQDAPDEHYQPGDTYPATADNPTVFSLVTVRAGRDTNGIDFVLNAEVLAEGASAGALVGGDTRVGDAAGGFHFADFYVFSAAAGANLAIAATGIGPTAQLRLWAPDVSMIAENTPVFNPAQINVTAPQTGIYRLTVFARATTGNPSSTGNYNLTLAGSSGAVPPTPVLMPAMAAAGSGNPGAQQFGNPLVRLPVLQVGVSAPSHESLWVDQLTVNVSGSANDVTDITAVRLFHDLDDDGVVDGGEPQLGLETFVADNGRIDFGLSLEVAAGETANLLVAIDATVVSVAPAGAGSWILLPLLGLLFWVVRPRRLRRATVLLLLATLVLPMSCGGGGGGANGPFDPTRPAVSFQFRTPAGGIAAATPTSDPAAPPVLPAADVVSGQLMVSS